MNKLMYAEMWHLLLRHSEKTHLRAYKNDMQINISFSLAEYMKKAFSNDKTVYYS